MCVRSSTDLKTFDLEPNFAGQMAQMAEIDAPRFYLNELTAEVQCNFGKHACSRFGSKWGYTQVSKITMIFLDIFNELTVRNQDEFAKLACIFYGTK